MAKRISTHWLPEAHERIMGLWEPFEKVHHADTKIEVLSLSQKYIQHFIHFHEKVLGQAIGSPLREHLDRFGINMAFIVFLAGNVIALERFRIYHEHDDSYSSILEAFIGIDSRYRGCGYGTVLREITKQYILKQPGVTALFSEVNADNMASRRSLEKAGYKQAGHPDKNIQRILYRALK